jgi:hypothetical protein
VINVTLAIIVRVVAGNWFDANWFDANWLERTDSFPEVL